ncbi:hypothetical protein KY316_01175 [Candidatus Woesearchaeota archaeon]|nr:hypothetical protein [Candidatus Woesearchaeota archaeon]
MAERMSQEEFDALFEELQEGIRRLNQTLGKLKPEDPLYGVFYPGESHMEILNFYEDHMK